MAEDLKWKSLNADEIFMTDDLKAKGVASVSAWLSEQTKELSEKITAVSSQIDFYEQKLRQLASLSLEVSQSLSNVTQDVIETGAYMLWVVDPVTGKPVTGGVDKLLSIISDKAKDVDDKDRPAFSNEAHLVGLFFILGYPSAEFAERGLEKWKGIIDPTDWSLVKFKEQMKWVPDKWKFPGK